MTDNDQLICTKAIEKFGETSQKIMFMEESAELIKELSKSMRGRSNITEIIEEIADVQIMLDQLKIIYDIGKCEVARINKMKKLERLVSE